MERKECFGSIREIALRDGLTLTQARPECRDCQEFRDCLRYSKESTEERKQKKEEKKERDELIKQNMIAQIIDLSQVLSNEVGSCLLEFLNRIYNSPLGMVLFKTFLLFYEISRDAFAHTLTIPISSPTLDLIRGGEVKGEEPVGQKGTYQRKGSREEFSLRIVLIQRSFPNNRKANMGLVAYEVARLFSSDSYGIHQILQVLNDSEINLFKKMNTEQRMDWLMERWGFLDELKELRREVALLEGKKRN